MDDDVEIAGGTERPRPAPTTRVGRGGGSPSIAAAVPPPTAPAEPAAEARSPAERLWEERLEGRLPQDRRSPIDPLAVRVLRAGEPVEEGRGRLGRGSRIQGLGDAPFDEEPEAVALVDRQGNVPVSAVREGDTAVRLDREARVPR